MWVLGQQTEVKLYSWPEEEIDFIFLELGLVQGLRFVVLLCDESMFNHQVVWRDGYN